MRNAGFVSLGFSVCAWLSVATSSESRADRIVLRGGGSVRGKVIADPKQPNRVVVLGERGKTPLSFQKAQVVQVLAEPSPLDEYLPLRAAADATTEAQYGLGLWCEQHKLLDLATLHYEISLKLDKSFAPAHRKLGHVLYNDRWLTGDELRLAQGLVRYKGKWITREEKDGQDKRDQVAAEQATWARRIRLLRDAVVNGNDDRRKEAESQLLEIRDPAAIVPLMKIMSEDIGRVRVLLSHILGTISETEATTALVRRLLDETDTDVRLVTMDELLRRKPDEVNRPLLKALRAENPEVVNRAAWALSHMDTVSAVPNLIGALITVRYHMEMSPSSGTDQSASSGMFGSVSPAGSLSPGVPIAFNGSSVGYLTGPSVGPGVVAYGATSLPAYPNPSIPLNPAILPGSAGLGIPGGGGLNASRGPVPKMVGVSFQNVEVLNALIKMTGQDFGYDMASWNRWMRTSFQPDPSPARKVPQP